MAVQPGVWGIDLGQCALKALRMENVEGRVTATAFDYVEHPKILSQPDADPDLLTREALEKFLSRNSIRGDHVIISIPGQSGLARFVKLPPVEEKKIPDIVRFEAKQQIPFNLEEVVWDYQKLGSGVVTDGFAMETEIGLFAIKRDTVNRYLQHFKDVNVEVHVVQMAPLALCNFISYDLLESVSPEGEGEDKKRCVVALDIGTDNSNLVITDGQRIIWQRPIPLGGNHFTRALTKDMKLTFAKAEHLKRNATKSPELKQILSSIKPVLNDFVSEVQRSLGYFTNTHRDAAVQYMIGLGSAFRLPGLQKFLGEKLQLEVRKLQKFERLAGDDVTNAPVYTENVLSFAVAYGLALQGLNLARLHTNLLPQDIRVDRLIRAKKPWAVAAAASMLLGMSALSLGYYMQYRAYAAPEVVKEMENGKKVGEKARNFETKVTQVLNQITKDKNAVKSIVFGQDERLNWMYFTQFINNTLPKPDGSNISEEAKQMFWNFRAEKAYEKFRKQVRGEGSPGDDESWRGDLIQANVEAVYCVFCDNLAGYYQHLKNDSIRKWDTMSERDRNTPPTGAGWVVELRGYTYHHDPYRFLAKAVVGNFARLPVKEPSPQAAPASASGTKAAPTAPAVPATPAPATPAAKSPVPAAAAVPDPIGGLVSHAVLYEFRDIVNANPAYFYLISKGVVDKLVGGSASTVTAGEMQMMAPIGQSGAGPQQGTSRSWSPLGAVSLGGSAEAGGRVSGGNTAGGIGGFVDRIGAGAAGGGSGAPATEASAKRRNLTRTEFILLFIWKEPTPSDQLLPPGEVSTKR
jgi:type IV pilus assembly protein PilM